jgi:hypothetical protein
MKMTMTMAMAFLSLILNSAYASTGDKGIKVEASYLRVASQSERTKEALRHVNSCEDGYNLTRQRITNSYDSPLPPVSGKLTSELKFYY